MQLAPDSRVELQVVLPAIKGEPGVMLILLIGPLPVLVYVSTCDSLLAVKLKLFGCTFRIPLAIDAGFKDNAF